MDYIITKDELTSLADAIRRFDGTSGTLSYPNGFESAFDAALPWDFEGQDYDIVGGEGKIGEDTNNIRAMAIDYCSYLRVDTYQSDINLKDVNFPELLSIGNPSAKYSTRGAFYSCNNLSTVFMPKVNIIGSYCFANKTLISKINLPECIDIERAAFSGCTSLYSVSIPKCVIIRGGAFYNTNLNSIDAPEVETLGTRGALTAVFKFTSSQTINEITFPKCENAYGAIIDNATINRLTFGAVSMWRFNKLGDFCSILELYLPECTDFDNDYFSKYSYPQPYLGSQISKLTLPKITNIVPYFAYSSSASATIFTQALKEIIAPNCTSIGSYAFYNCSQLESANFNGCLSIGSRAFTSCHRLESIKLDACKKIFSYAFAYCGFIQGETPVLNIDTLNCTYIGSSAFLNCANLNTIKIYSNLEDNDNYVTLGGGAFQGCNNLTDVGTINLKTINSECFLGCSNLININIPKCTNIQEGGFQFCRSLISIDLPVCETISTRAFSGCLNLLSINLPMGTLIGETAFANCQTLSQINISVCSTIGISAFKHCFSLNNITLGSNITTISTGAFYSCSALDNLIILNSTAVPVLGDSNVFTGTALSGTGSGYIYVQSNLLSSYKTATNWALYASHIKAIGT